MLGREPGRDPARVGKGNTGIAGGGGLDAKCRVLTETAGGPSLACGRLVPWRPVVTGPPSVEAHKPTVRAPSSRGCGWFTSARSLSLYLADAGVSPELEALSRGASCVGKALSLGLSRERGGLARERRERGRGLGQALECTHTSAEAKPRSLARSPVRRGRPVRERWRDSRCTRTHSGVSRSQLPEALLRGRPRQRPHRDERNGSRQLPAFKPRRVWLVP